MKRPTYSTRTFTLFLGFLSSLSPLTETQPPSSSLLTSLRPTSLLPLFTGTSRTPLPILGLSPQLPPTQPLSRTRESSLDSLPRMPCPTSTERAYSLRSLQTSSSGPRRTHPSQSTECPSTHNGSSPSMPQAITSLTLPCKNGTSLCLPTVPTLSPFGTPWTNPLGPDSSSSVRKHTNRNPSISEVSSSSQTLLISLTNGD